MKHLIIVLIFILLTSVAYAEPQSMRYVATNEVFDGIWEEVYDPIDLKKIDQFYFFTNFADFSIEYNDLYGSISDKNEVSFFEEFPLGIAFTNPFHKSLKHSFYMKYRNNLVPGNLSTSGSGEYEEFETSYVDNTGDGVFDSKVMSYVKEQDKVEDEGLFNFIWNNNMQFDSYSIGLKFSSFSVRKELDNSQSRLGVNNFGNYTMIDGFYTGSKQKDLFEEFYRIDEDEYYFRYHEEGDFSTEMKNSEQKILLSFEIENHFLIKNSLLRFDLGVNILQDLSRDTNDKYNGSYEEIIVADTLVYSGEISETFKRKLSRNENEWHIGSLLKKELESSFARRVGFWETGLHLGIVSGRKEDLSRNQFAMEEIVDSLLSVDYTIVQSNNNFSLTNEDGDIIGIRFSTHFLLNLPLNNNAAFGLGGFYHFSQITGNYDYVSYIDNLEIYQLGQQIDTASEFTKKETEYLSADKQSIVSTTNFIFPIALEFKIPESHTSQYDGFGLRNFTFRIGSTFYLNSTKAENTYDVIKKEPNFVITEYGDGTISENHDSQVQLNSNKEITKTIESKKRFSAGIGYTHSKNVSIDLGSYYDYKTDNYYVGLSFTIGY